MGSLPERLARLEEQVDGIDAKVDRNSAEATNWRMDLTTKVDALTKSVQLILDLLNQAKGARWLAGLLLSGVFALSVIGLKTLFEWFMMKH